MVKAQATITLSRVNDGSPGAPGRTYFIEPSTLVLKKGQDNVISPGTVDFKAYYRDGNSASRTAYAGRFKIEETVDGTTWKTIYTSKANESSVKHSTYDYITDAAGNAIITASGHGIVAAVRDIHMIRCTLYAAGGTTNALDTQSVTVVKDVDNLKPEEVFDLLTENGKIQGFYKEDGQIYINSTYIKSGTFVAGGANNQNGKIEVRDSSNQVIGRWDKDGIYIESGTIVSKNQDKKNGIEISGGRAKFLYDSSDVGYIGTNIAQGTSMAGLVFDLEIDGKFMLWAKKINQNENLFTPVMYYSKEQGILDSLEESVSVATNLDLRSFELKRAYIRDFSVRGSFKIPNNVSCDVYSDINFHNWRIKNVKIENIDSINGIKPYSGTKAFGTGMYITVQNGIITNIA